MKQKIHVILFSMTIFLFSCHQAPLKNKQKIESTNRSEMYGHYQALLRPINPLVANEIRGSLTLVKERGELVSHVRFSGGPPSILLIQNIHTGKRCPKKEDDLNQDGYIDAIEGQKIFKHIIVPLDDDLNSQRMGGGIFPVSDNYGYYFYTRIANWMKLLEDLNEEDINPEDDYIKLKQGELVDLEGQIIVIQGVPENTPLPETVDGKGRLTKFQAMPVACGIITKLTYSPGKIEDDVTDIAPPVGEPIDGVNDIDDGADFSTSSDSHSTGVDYDENARLNDNDFLN